MLTALLLLDRAHDLAGNLFLEVAWRIAQAREPRPPAPTPEPKGEAVDVVEPDAAP